MKIYVKPAAGGLVRDPADGNAPLPAHGKGVEKSVFWDRRLRDGDVELTDEKAVAAAEAEIAAKAAEAAQASATENQAVAKGGKITAAKQAKE